MGIKPALPQAARINIFYRKISSVALLWGTWLRTHFSRDREEKKKALHLVGFEPTTSMSWGSHVLYHYATSADLVIASTYRCIDRKPKFSHYCWQPKSNLELRLNQVNYRLILSLALPVCTAVMFYVPWHGPWRTVRKSSLEDWRWVKIIKPALARAFAFVYQLENRSPLKKIIWDVLFGISALIKWAL